MHVTLHDGKVLTLQPDNSLTILDAETGELLLRGKSVMPAYRDDELHLGAAGYGFTLIPYGKILLATSWGPGFLLTMHDGEPIASSWHFTHGGLETEANRLFAVSPGNSGSSQAYCLDMTGGGVLWKTEVAGRWDDVFIVENNLYLFRDELDGKRYAVLGKNGVFIGKTDAPPAPMHNAEAERLSNMAKADSSAEGDRVVVHASSYGRIEGIDRATGESLWLYGFPRKNMGKWDKRNTPVLLRFSIANWTQYEPEPREPPSLFEKARRFLGALYWYWGKDFYTEDRKEFDEDMRLSGAAGVSAPGQAASTPRLVLDSKVVEFDTVASWIAAIANWSAVAVSAYALFNVTEMRPRPSAKIRLLVVVVALNLLVLLLFGRYDRLCFRILWYSALAAYMVIAHTMIRYSAELADSST